MSAPNYYLRDVLGNNRAVISLGVAVGTGIVSKSWKMGLLAGGVSLLGIMYFQNDISVSLNDNTSGNTSENVPKGSDIRLPGNPPHSPFPDSAFYNN